MKTSTASIFASLSLALIVPLSAQVAAPATPAAASTPAEPANAAPMMENGIVFYNGLPYLLRNGRAFLIDATLIPAGQILTHEGKFAPLPTSFTAFPAPMVKKGTDQQTVQGSVPIVAPETTAPVQKGTDQQTLINPPRTAPDKKTTGSGGVIRK